MLKPIDYNKHFVIGTPLVAWKCDKNEHMSWLQDKMNIINMIFILTQKQIAMFGMN
jgi:hypothetical protein